VRPLLTVEPHLAPMGPSLRVAGELDIATGSLLRDALLRYADGGEGPVVVDMAGVHFIDSSGIAVLVYVQNRLSYQGRGLELHPVSPEVNRVIDVVGLAERLGVDQTTFSD
jgi:anti-anti-sigma factor